MEENNNKRKIVIPMALGIAVLTILVLGATYAYFTVGTSNNFGSKTKTATTPDVGSVTLSSGESLSLNMTSELMMEENVGTYYATTTGVPSTTLTEVDIATATVTGAGNFNCTYDLTITPSATNSLYTAFTGMTGHDAGQIVLKVGSHTYDFNTTDFSSSITINETFNNVTSSASKSIKASLKFVNSDYNQDALQGKDITFTFTASNLSCTAVSAPVVARPAYYAFGTPTAESPTTPPEGYNVYVGLYDNNDLAVCINRNGTEHCFKSNNWEEEQNHIQQVYSDISCFVDSSRVSCNAPGFYCIVRSIEESARNNTEFDI